MKKGNSAAGCVLVLLGMLAGLGRAGEIVEEAVTFRGTDFRVVKVEPGRLRLFSEDGFISVRSLGLRVRSEGKRLLFAMNSGIFERGWVASGLHVEEGRELVPVNRKAGEKLEGGADGGLVTPNFYLKPNGIFFVGKDGEVGVMETEKYVRLGKEVRLATQSGPLLLEKGKVHPAFREGSANVRHRNGVGVDKEGRVVMAITADGETVNFFDFAMLFAELGCEDALYLDGDLSVMAVGEKLERGKEPAGGLGGILGVVGE